MAKILLSMVKDVFREQWGVEEWAIKKLNRLI
jgi:hypothetical protein